MIRTFKKNCNYLIKPFRVFMRTKSLNYPDHLKQFQNVCGVVCPQPRVPKRKVTILGAGCEIGQIIGLLLKRSAVIDTLCLYDEDDECRVLYTGKDLGFINTNPRVEVYQGQAHLKWALKEAEVVVICGGTHMKPSNSFVGKYTFCKNVNYMRSVALACSEFCSHAIIACITPPVDIMFSIIVHILTEAGTYDKRRVLGINSIASVRATSLMCAITGTDPAKSSVPIVGGAGSMTLVPVFSAEKTARSITQTQLDCLTHLVRDADNIICKVKNNGLPAQLSIGYATARCIDRIMTGLFVKPTKIDSALIEQPKVDQSYGLKFCSSSMTIGREGIQGTNLPKLSAMETQLLKKSECELEDNINIGKCYAVGHEYVDPMKSCSVLSDLVCKVCACECQ